MVLYIVKLGNYNMCDITRRNQSSILRDMIDKNQSYILYNMIGKNQGSLLCDIFQSFS